MSTKMFATKEDQEEVESKYTWKEIKEQLDKAIESRYNDSSVAYTTIARGMMEYNKMIDEKCNKKQHDNQIVIKE